MANGRKTAAALMTMAMAIPGVAEAQSGRPRLTRHAMGAAQGCAAESAVAAHIFYANVVGFAVERGGNIARVLGYAISHEIGHLLLPTCGHSTTGLMSAHWGTKELKEMAQGRMTFHDLQEAQIRTLLERSQLKAMR